MRGINKVILVGTLGIDPDVKFTAQGLAVANLSVATSEEWKDKTTGQKQQKTEWHRIVIFGKLAEIARDYLKKGSQVYIEGKLQTRKWKDQTGQDRYSTEVVLNGFDGTMEMLGAAKPGTHQDPVLKPKKEENSYDRPSSNASTLKPAPFDEFDDLDVPF